VLASEEIRQALLAAKAKKLPIVVSMANVAASGGYWVSTPADRIFAEPETITGSIGVFGILPSFDQALAKIGVNADGIATTPLSGQPDVFGGVNDEFNALAQASVEDIYARFTGLVAKSRKQPIEKIRTIAEGRVWAGGTARQIGLDRPVRRPARRAESRREAREGRRGFPRQIFRGRAERILEDARQLVRRRRRNRGIAARLVRDRRDESPADRTAAGAGSDDADAGGVGAGVVPRLPRVPSRRPAAGPGRGEGVLRDGALALLLK
jgi:signal peptide peptidase SppA